MRYQVKPIYCRPWLLNGLSLKLIESHYENNYGGALRRLNAITEQLESLDCAKTPGYVINGLNREELVALNSTLLHELYFASMGGDGRVTNAMSEALARDFGSVQRWRTEFSAMGYALGGGSGWVLLFWMPRDGRLINQYASEHSQAIASAIPLLALDMYEHAYHIDFGANATAYVDAFMRNVDWAAVTRRIVAASADRPLPQDDPVDHSLPSLSVEELAARLAKGEPVQVLDARPRHHISRTVDLMQGAIWRDPDRVDEWIGELSTDEPVAVYCAYGFHVGCSVTRTLRERGFDARFIRGGVSAWYAAGEIGRASCRGRV